ncbi:hypothetical protein AX16_001429 [Volvariella volvacea WC 439]|nr:hypothetical protein AX16_001429 [Volvariella volvacea WC 439]
MSASNGKAAHAAEERDAAELKKAIATGQVKEASSSTAMGSIICYCFASIIMTVVNKFVVSGANFSMNFLLLTIQSGVCVACVLACKKAGIISFRDFDTQDAKSWFPISFFLNLTIILIAYGEVIWFGGKVTALIFVSFVFMVVSSVIAAWSDTSNTFGDSMPAASSALTLDSLSAVTGAVRQLNIGYLWMMLNCLASAAYVLTMRKRIKATGFSDWDSMFYNNLLSVPILVVFSFLVEDWSTENLSRNFPEETRNILLSAIVFSGAAAVGISYTTAWCIRVTSSTTYSMVGALNKLPVAASGMLFFGDPVTFGSVTAVLVGFFAGVVYAVAKNNQKKAESRMQANGIIPLSNVQNRNS